MGKVAGQVFWGYQQGFIEFPSRHKRIDKGKPHESIMEFILSNLPREILSYFWVEAVVTQYL